MLTKFAATLMICVAFFDSRVSGVGRSNQGTDSMFDYSSWQSDYSNGYIVNSDKTSPSLFYLKNRPQQVCSSQKTCYDCALSDCEWTYSSDGQGSCGGRISVQYKAGPTYDDFFGQAFQCRDDQNLCLNQEDAGGNKTLGFQTNAGKTIPANYICTEQWSRGNLSFSFQKAN